MSFFALVQTACLTVLALILIAAAWQDLRTMKIGNGLVVATVVAFAVWTAAGIASGHASALELGEAVLCSLLLFGLGAAGFAAGILGGGDVKLLAAASLFAGPAHIVDFLTITALTGGLLGAAVLAGAPIGPAVDTAAPAADGTVRTRLRRGLPYGPAIAAGGLWVATILSGF